MKTRDRILVIDDDPGFRKTLVQVLTAKGYDAQAAATGGEAIRAAENGNFAVALIDLILPDLSGLEIMARIRAVSPATEAIILTGNASMDSAMEATRQGAFSYLHKPYQINELLQKVSEGVAQAREKAARLALPSGAKKRERILIVDDDPNLLKTLSDVLRTRGYDAVTAASGAEALAAAKKEIFSVVLIDLLLPDMPGLDVMARIREISEATETIIQSGQASVESVIEAIRQGAFSYIIKPYEIDDLLKKIREGIERQRAQEEIIRLASFPRLHPNPVFELGVSGEVTYANPAADRLFPDLRKKGMSHPLLSDGAGSVIRSLREGHQQGEASHEIRLGAETYELHVSYIREVDLIRVSMLSVTDRVNANKRANDLSLIAEHTQDVVVITDASGYMTWINKPFEDLTGYSFDECMGKKPGALLQGPDTDPKAIDALRAAIAAGQPLDIEILNYSKQKQPYWLEINLYPVRDDEGKLVKFIAVERDISKRKKADAEISLHRDHLEELVQEKTREMQLQVKQYREQKNLLDQILENIPLAIFAKDPQNDYRMVMCNRASEEMFGYKKQDFLGSRDIDFFPKSEADFFRATDERVMAGGKLVEIEVEPVTTTIGLRKAHTIKVPVYGDDKKPALLLAIVEDVTDKIKSQEDLRIAKEQAEQATHAKSDFLANMSHEIRTPMNGIIGLIRLLADTDLDRDQEQSVQAILTSGETLLFLLNDILDFSKIEANELTLEKLPFNLDESLRNVISLLAPMASKKAVVLNYHFDKDTPPGVIGDPTRIGQIVTNLLGNAIKFTENGHVTLTVSATERKPQEDYLYTFSVEDTGIGISPEVQGLIFRKFTQSDSSTSRKFGGTGLGLAISKSLTEIMGGNISLSSTLGRGSVFTARIPLQKAEVLPLKEGKSLSGQHRLSTFDTFANRRILVVDDHPINMLFAQKILKTMGFTRIDAAANGLEALDKLKNSGKAYDIVLMDCQMPGMDGFEASRDFRAWESANGAKRTPIVAMTARAMQGDRDLCLQSGMDDYLSKPVNPDKLHDILSRWLIDPVNTARAGKGAPTGPADDAEAGVIDIAYLEQFTDGDLDDEKVLSDLFLKAGAESIAVLRSHQESVSGDKAWSEAAHRLKGSAAQIGANDLSAHCAKAEEGGKSSPEEKRVILSHIEERFLAVQNFFQRRQR